jgi:2-keto-4-pentenoate hydratase/2-oxohepta-3-ene-1,7-dioic acid hydratase in catechol pathway
MNYLFDNLIKTNQNKIFGLARNYLKQAIEAGAKDLPTYPLVFGKSWSSIIYEPNHIRIKTVEGHVIDHEGN